MQYLVALCNRPEGASDVISGRFMRQIVLAKCEESETFSRNSAEAADSGYFRHFFRYNFQLRVENDVLSGVAINYAGMDVHVKIWRF